MDAIRKLFYEEKTSLDDFGINDDGSLNQLIYEEWLLTRREMRGDDSCILKVFNDAYYLCTLVWAMPDAKLKVQTALKWFEIPSVVIPLTRFYLSRVEYLPKGVKWFWKSMEGVFEDDWERNLNTLEELTSNNKSVITPEMFVPRALTVDLLSSLSEKEWRRITKNYSIKYIQIAVTARAKNKDEWHMMVEAIKAAAIKYDYDFGFEEEEIDGFDEDGPYTQIVRVPINPYDLDGNEILEPLKRAGVYQFCDELKEKYKELVLASQPMEDKSDSTKTKYQLIDIKLSDMSTDIDKKKRISQLPDVLNTEIARSIFSKCIEKGWIEETETGYSWKGLKTCSGRIAQLSYLCGKIYGFKYDKVSKNLGSEFPDEALCKLFNEKYLEKQLVQVYSAAKPQKWRAVLDELFV